MLARWLLFDHFTKQTIDEEMNNKQGGGGGGGGGWGFSFSKFIILGTEIQAGDITCSPKSRNLGHVTTEN